jgi:hypothetical protein
MTRHVLEKTVHDHDGMVSTIDFSPEAAQILAPSIVLELENS